MANFTEQQWDDLIEAIQDLSRERCDFTGWNRTEAIAALALELKRYNDRQK